MKTIIPSLILLLSSLSVIAKDSGAKWDDYTPKQITAEVAKQFQAEPKTIALRVKGLVCESCGIGIRKKIQKLHGVDKKRFNKGIKMDVFRMVIYVAYIEIPPTKEQLVKAVEDAGYKALYLYTQNGNKVSTSNL